MIAEEAAEVRPRSDLVDPRGLAVTGYRLDAEGTELQVHYTGGTEHCFGLAQASVAPDGEALRVTVAEGRLPGIDDACEAIGVPKFVTLRLDEPLIVQAAFDT